MRASAIVMHNPLPQNSPQVLFIPMGKACGWSRVMETYFKVFCGPVRSIGSRPARTPLCWTTKSFASTHKNCAANAEASGAASRFQRPSVMGLLLSQRAGSMFNKFNSGSFGLYCTGNFVPIDVFCCMKSRVSSSIEKAGPTHSPE
jgi:hypothetical protein